MTTVLERLYSNRLIITFINIDSERQLVNVFMVSIDWTNFEKEKTFKINYIHNNVILISTSRYCSGPRFTKRSSIVRLPTYLTTIYRLSLRPFHKTCRKVFFTISDLRLVAMASSLCGGTKIDQFTRAARVRLSDKFIYSFKQNIKYSYFIGLCRYKSHA